MIALSRAENPRYTIWRALHPDAMLYELGIWIRAEWRAFFDGRGLKPDTSSAGYQQEFNAWLLERHDAKYVELGQGDLFSDSMEAA